MAFLRDMLVTPIAKTTVTTVGNPSGIAATANATAVLKAEIKSPLLKYSSPKTIMIINKDKTPTSLPI